mmetsp:Transcript_84461/g.225646  ORF Transcript_84461/g.225646 Transcript_84461/m.225646 type:complete len:97 (-) Transcript_84461:152-442(-)
MSVPSTLTLVPFNKDIAESVSESSGAGGVRAHRFGQDCLTVYQQLSAACADQQQLYSELDRGQVIWVVTLISALPSFKIRQQTSPIDKCLFLLRSH